MNEKVMAMEKDLIKYKNRQIVINEYENEELTSRDGFFVERIVMNRDSIQLISADLILYQVHLNSDSEIRRDNRFLNFFHIEVDQQLRIEIYFP
jgi:hypothetical protein